MYLYLYDSRCHCEPVRTLVWQSPGSSCNVHLFPVAVPDIFLAGEAAASAIDHCHLLASFLPPPAAGRSLPIPNTEVKRICNHITWRATAREDR